MQTKNARTLSAPEAARLGEEQSPAYDWYREAVIPYLEPDGRRRHGGRLIWHEWMPGVMRTTDRKYAIVRTFIPGKDGPEEVFLLREGHFSTDCWGPNHLGTTAGDYPRIDFALDEAERRDWSAEMAGRLDVAEEIAGALAYTPFFRPIDRSGTTRNGLAVERDDDGCTAVRLYAMTRTDGDNVKPYVLAALDITDLVGRFDARPEARRTLVQSILLAAAFPYRVGHIMDRLGPAIGVFPRDSNARRDAVVDVLAELVDDGWAELDGKGEFQVAERYTPPAEEPGTGRTLIRAAIREHMLSLNPVPVHRADIINLVSEALRATGFFPDPVYVEKILDEMVTERFLGDTRLNTYTVTRAARHHYEEAARRPVEELPELGTSVACTHGNRQHVREAILTVLLRRPGQRTGVNDLVDLVDQLLEERDDCAVARRTVHNVAADLLNEGALFHPAKGYVQLTGSALAEWNASPVTPHQARLARVAADVLEIVTRKPGNTFQGITFTSTRFGSIGESERALAQLIADRKVTVTEDGQHFNSEEPF